MNALSRFYKNQLPPAITQCIVWAQLHLFPAPFYRRRAGIFKQIGLPTTVQQGPFAGMVYARFAADKILGPRLMGTYEKETYPAVEDLIARQPEVVANVGAGEGYFAVGLARRLPHAATHAYDMFPWARYLMTQMAQRNKVQDHLHVHGFCDAVELQRVLDRAARPALVLDVDGYEYTLLDPQKVPALRRAIMLVETHDHLDARITPAIMERFGATHNAVTMQLGDRTEADLPQGAKLTPADTQFLLDEMQFRGVRQSWIYLTPRG